MLSGPTTDTKNKADGGRTQTVSLSGSVPELQSASLPSRRKLATMQKAFGNQVVLRMMANSAQRDSKLRRKCGCVGSSAGGECTCASEHEAGLNRLSTAGGASDSVPPVVHEVLRSSGEPLDAGVRASLEPRLGRNFEDVRVHTDAKAAVSAKSINALAYTAGSDVVFGAGQYKPSTAEGRRIITHELAHVIQQGGGRAPLPQRIGAENDPSEVEADRVADIADGSSGAMGYTTASLRRTFLQRASAGQLSCGSGPLTLDDGTVIDDPVGVITAAETTVNQLLDSAIAELDFTIQQIRGGAAIAFPTISDALALGLQIMGLDPNSDRVWNQDGGVGNYTAALLLKRLRLVRSTIGAGTFFFVCLGPAVGTIGVCAGAICQGANSRSCAGSFQIDLCTGFWEEDAASQAGTILHESTHNFAFFVQDVGREGNAECYARFAQVVGGSDVGGQRLDLCPDP
jgi:hypothetical protein